MLSCLEVRYPEIRVVFAESWRFAEEWTYRFSLRRLRMWTRARLEGGVYGPGEDRSFRPLHADRSIGTNIVSAGEGTLRSATIRETLRTGGGLAKSRVLSKVPEEWCQPRTAWR